MNEIEWKAKDNKWFGGLRSHLLVDVPEEGGLSQSLKEVKSEKEEKKASQVRKIGMSRTTGVY